MFWALAWGLKIGAFVASSWLANKLMPDDANAPKPAGNDDIQAPTVEEGRAITVIWGTCLLKSPNVLWYGDLRSEETEYGFKYYLSMMWSWCHGPIDAIVSLLWDDLEVVLRTNPLDPETTIPYPILRENPPSSIWVYGASLFGGNEKEGGVYGYYEFYWGSADQSPDEYLAGILDVPEEEFPAYRGLCHSIAKWSYNHPFYQGTSAYVKPHSMIARRCPNQLGLTGGKENIDGDANAACLIYELLTDDRWGVRLSPALIDVAAFQAVGEALATEDFGVSFQQTQQTDTMEIVNEVLRHVDGVIFPNRTTGLISLALIRDDYDPETLVEIDDDCIIEVEEFSRPGPETLPNKVLLKYIDRDQHYEEKVATAVDLAGVQCRGGVIPQDVSFLGISKAATAQKIAARELKAMAYPFASLRLRTNRVAWNLRPGSPFKFTCGALGISGMVCRVVSIAFGPITDGEIRLDAIEDAFGVDWTAYSPPAASQWSYPL